MSEKTPATSRRDKPVACTTCRFHPDDCGYWELDGKKDGKGNYISLVHPESEHGCPDWEFREFPVNQDNAPPYTYKDFVTGKTRCTWGHFESWSKPTGPLNVRYAIFKTPKTRVCVPHYCLTKETKAKLPPRPREEAPQ